MCIGDITNWVLLASNFNNFLSEFVRFWPISKAKKLSIVFKEELFVLVRDLWCYLLLSDDVAVIQWITSGHKK